MAWLVRFDEVLLFEIASAYEAGTKHGRRTDSGRYSTNHSSQM
jgi:hypothetical protein